MYVEEVLHALIEDGTLVQSAGGWQLAKSLEHIHVPDTLEQLIQSRIDGLDFSSPGARRVLWMAAVIGQEFNQELLSALFSNTGRSKEELRRHLDELEVAAMVNKVSKSQPHTAWKAVAWSATESRVTAEAVRGDVCQGKNVSSADGLEQHEAGNL